MIDEVAVKVDVPAIMMEEVAPQASMGPRMRMCARVRACVVVWGAVACADRGELRCVSVPVSSVCTCLVSGC